MNVIKFIFPSVNLPLPPQKKQKTSVWHKLQ